jgi:hypothetical protein
MKTAHPIRLRQAIKEGFLSELSDMGVGGLNMTMFSVCEHSIPTHDRLCRTSHVITLVVGTKGCAARRMRIAGLGTPAGFLG